MAQELYKLPKGWEWKKLGQLCSMVGGATPSKAKSEYWNGSIRWASVRDLNVDSLTETEFSISQDALESCSTNLIPPESLIIATRVGLGKVVINKISVAINQDLRAIIPQKEFFTIFGFYWFKSIAPFLIASGTGSTVKGVKSDFIRELHIPLPPLPEQKRIVQRLEALQAKQKQLRETLNEKIAGLNALKASLLDAAFRGEL